MCVCCCLVKFLVFFSAWFWHRRNQWKGWSKGKSCTNVGLKTSAIGSDQIFFTLKSGGILKPPARSMYSKWKTIWLNLIEGMLTCVWFSFATRTRVVIQRDRRFGWCKCSLYCSNQPFEGTYPSFPRFLQQLPLFLPWQRHWWYFDHSLPKHDRGYGYTML